MRYSDPFTSQIEKRSTGLHPRCGGNPCVFWRSRIRDGSAALGMIGPRQHGEGIALLLRSGMDQTCALECNSLRPRGWL